jgi:hypothetical protein
MEHLTASEPGVDLYWLPLGAGGHSVRLNGRVFEAVAARLDRRPPCDLYHSALEVRVPEGRFVIEMAPVLDGNGEQRGVVAEGVGSRWAGRVRIFRYEVRRWREGVIPDIHEAVESPRHLSADQDLAQRVLYLALQVPTPVWGRDELGAGEMWNRIRSSAGYSRGAAFLPSRSTRRPVDALLAGMPGWSWRAASRSCPIWALGDVPRLVPIRIRVASRPETCLHSVGDADLRVRVHGVRVALRGARRDDCAGSGLPRLWRLAGGAAALRVRGPRSPRHRRAVDSES